MSFLSNVVGGSRDDIATYFEMVMVEQGSRSISPAFSQIVETIRDNYPASRFACFAHRASQELLAGLRCLGEAYFLFQHNASAFEMLYGLRRANVTLPPKQGESYAFFGNKQRLASLVELVFAPYIAAKMDKFYKRAKLSQRPSGAYEKNTERQNDSRHEDLASKGGILNSGISK